ncbi:NAD(P)/FAD-dependent oxidoreductase [Gloeobacter kilaueensis]|uniref:NAD(P)/FAD-dependent oxidoreductase n=1 Tax=Gloeobacter kilaueensis TaxID=1416614 RepID=UPI00040AF3BB|nr:FAD-dependent oxidoreductase [Gloeobacter kilaueensis]
MRSSQQPTLILGGGFTGLFAALHLSHRNYPRPIILIDDAERFVFKPLLYEYLSGEMSSDQVCPLFSELLEHRGVTFVQGCVNNIDLTGRRVRLAEGTEYGYEYLVLGLGSTTGYFGVPGAQQNTFAFRTGEDALLLARHLRDCLQRASQTSDRAERRKLLSVAVVGGGPSGVELAATLGDLLPQWYEPLGGDPRELQIVLINHGKMLLEGDINSKLRSAATEALASRRAPVRLQLVRRWSRCSRARWPFSPQTRINFGGWQPRP